MGPIWRRASFWQFVTQAIVLVALVSLVVFLGRNLDLNLKRIGLRVGFKFLESQAGFSIGDTVIPYDPSDNYWRALGVGLLNSLKVILSGLVLATIVGMTAGVARLSNNWLVRKLATLYVESLRNLPLLIQLFFWYFAVFLSLPPAESPLKLGLLELSQNEVVLLGLRLSPEFSALLLGLAIYTGTFIAEIVRGSILAVPQGQWEAARSLGLSNSDTLRRIIFPQAWRTMIPSISNQYLNLAKNSSLAIAIGYHDLYTTASITFNQTGRAVEMMILICLTYLLISLMIAASLNFYNRRVQLVER